MGKNTFVIADITFREAIRDRILYAVLGFGMLFILSDLFVAKLALGDFVIIKSFGLAGLYIFGLAITIFLGASIIYKEIERHTLYFVLSKPVSRSDVIVGKFLGLFAAVFLTTLLMTLIYLAVVLYQGGGFDHGGLLAIFFQIAEEGFFIALLVFFSSFTAPLTSTISALMLLFVGHLLNSVLDNARQIGGLTYRMAGLFYYLLPNLEKFNIRNSVVHGVLSPPSAILLTIAYALLYSVLLLYCAVVLFKKREL